MLQIVIPAAGNGARFAEAGYEDPKPLIDVMGKPMIERVIENLVGTGRSRVIIVSRLGASDLLRIGSWPFTALQLGGPTRGAVDTILQAAHLLTDDSLLIANCDQLVAFDVDDFLARAEGFDGSLVTFRSTKSHHSYVLTGHDGAITAIREKEVISNQAVTGVYFFRYASDFVAGAQEVMRLGRRVKDEFYVSTVIDFLIEHHLRLTTYDAPSAMLGTPEELQLFLAAVRVGRSM